LAARREKALQAMEATEANAAFAANAATVGVEADSASEGERKKFFELCRVLDH
jgi:hypothetical protein